jgi:hypothetical protein
MFHTAHNIIPHVRTTLALVIPAGQRCTIVTDSAFFSSLPEYGPDPVSSHRECRPARAL